MATRVDSARGERKEGGVGRREEGLVAGGCFNWLQLLQHCGLRKTDDCSALLNPGMLVLVCLWPYGPPGRMYRGEWELSVALKVIPLIPLPLRDKDIRPPSTSQQCMAPLSARVVLIAIYRLQSTH